MAKKIKFPKKHDSISKRKLVNLYDEYVTEVLDAYLQRESHSKLPCYRVMQELPTVEAYGVMRTAKYTVPISELLEDACGDIEELASELDDWYNNLPESFQNGEKGEQLQEAASSLQNIERLEWPKDCPAVMVLYLPGLKVNSRADRAAEDGAALTACSEKLREVLSSDADLTDRDGLSELADECENAASELESVEFPGMY